jgi:hypothetical protein
LESHQHIRKTKKLHLAIIKTYLDDESRILLEVEIELDVELVFELKMVLETLEISEEVDIVKEMEDKMAISW